jgi:acyl carrier protein
MVNFEHIVSEVWSDVLGETGIDPDINFFDAGGDSILLMTVHSRLQKLLGIKIDIVDLFEFTTIRTLAERLTQTAAESTIKQP